MAIEDGVIAAVGTTAELGEGERFPDSAIVPGFVNAHTHLEYAVYAGFGDGLSFGPWISTHIERKQRLTRPDMEAIARLGAAECLRSGITTVGDLAFTGASAHACAELGLRAIVYLEVFGKDGDEAIRQFEEKRAYVSLGALGARPRRRVAARALHLLARGLRRRNGARHCPWRRISTRARTSSTGCSGARAPGSRWRRCWSSRQGTSGIRSLAAAGLLDERVAAAHCVKVDAEEIGLLAAHGVAVTHCPRSNALLGCGIAPLEELRAAGLRIGIGTDGVSSVPSHDFFEELRTAISFARARSERADALSAAAALELATLGGARALGLDAETGSLVPGKRADLTIVSLSGSPYLPWEDPAAAVVYGGSPGRITATLVDGQTRFEKGGSECHELIDAARAARGRMLRAESATAIS